MNDVPDWYQAILLFVAAWRCFHLIAHDDIFDRPRRYVTRLDPGWEEEGDPTGPEYREKLGEFLTCPFCLGFWVVILWWIAWIFWPDATVIAAVPFALSAGLVGVHKLLSSE